MLVLNGANLILLGFVLALVFGILATLAIIYQLRSARRQEAKAHEAESKRQALLRDVHAVTQAMNEGLYLLRLEGESLVVETPYSPASTFPEGSERDPLEKLFDASELPAEQIQEIFKGLRSSFGGHALQWDFQLKSLPEELRIASGTASKVLSLRWKSIRSADGKLVKILLMTSDISELRTLQDDARTRYDDAKRLMELIGNSPKKIGEYFALIESILAEAKANATRPDGAILNFRNIHTLKGMARGYRLEELSLSLKALEDALQDNPEAARSLQHQPALIACETSLRAYKRLFFRVYTQKMANAQVSADPKVILALTHQIEVGFMRSDMGSAFAAVNEIRSIFACTLDKIIIDEISMVKAIADDLRKPQPNIYTNELDMQVSEECKIMLRKVFVHLFRNSLDHGLESEAMRLAEKKEVMGQISIQTEQDGDVYRIRYSDDGQGLRLETILKKAMDLGIASRSESYTDQAIADMIFEPGLSTASRGSSFSGRGVGMDAVRSFLRQGGGQISIQLGRVPDEGGNGRPFSFLIEVPVERVERPLRNAV